MKFVLVSAVAPVLILTLSTSLNAASSKQARPTTVSDPSKVQSWEDHEKLKDLKDVLFDFDTHSVSDHAAAGSAKLSFYLPKNKDNYLELL